MSLAKVKLRLLSRRNLDKADVESIYGELVRVIGGTFFSSGTAVGPANGLLDWRNFSPDSGILNQYKSNPYSVSAVQADIPTVTAGGGLAANQYNMQMPWDYVSPLFANALIIGITVACETISNAVNSGTVQINVNGSNAQNFTWTNAATTNAILVNSATSPFIALTTRDRLVMQISATGGNLTNVKLHAWVKILHSRG
jgi:hypothetical protein